MCLAHSVVFSLVEIFLIDYSPGPLLVWYIQRFVGFIQTVALRFMDVICTENVHSFVTYLQWTASLKGLRAKLDWLCIHCSALDLLHSAITKVRLDISRPMVFFLTHRLNPANKG